VRGWRSLGVPPPLIPSNETGNTRSIIKSKTLRRAEALPREARCVHRRVRLVVGDSDSGVVAVVETVGEAGSATVVPRVDVRIVGG
jgi:hypothetical protein